MRKSVAVTIAACILAATAGCSAIQQPSSCDPIASTGAASKLVSATGKVGVAPSVSFPTPVITKKLETTVLTAGTGRELYNGEVADVQASIYSGATGELLTATDYDPASQPLRVTVGDWDAVSAASTIARVVQCQTVGTRAATVTTVAEMFGPDALDPSLGLANSDTLVVVTDIQGGFIGRADGPLQSVKSGFPSVVTTVDGTPGVTLPNENPPTTLKIETIREGHGATVKEGDSVVLHYTGLLWNKDGQAGTVFQSTWTDTPIPTPATLTASAMSADGSGGLVPGFAKALIGSTVGSQVIAVIPPKDGYPAGASPATVPEGSTMVFVFDVLGIQ